MRTSLLCTCALVAMVCSAVLAGCPGDSGGGASSGGASSGGTQAPAGPDFSSREGTARAIIEAARNNNKAQFLQCLSSATMQMLSTPELQDAMFNDIGRDLRAEGVTVETITTGPRAMPMVQENGQWKVNLAE